MKGSIRGLLIAVMLVTITLPTAWADGLERFERQIRPLLAPLDLTWGRATALGPSGFALEDVRGVIKDDRPGEPPVPFTAKRVVVEDVDFDHLGKDDGPHFLKLRIEGAAAGGVAADWLGDYGLSSATLDFAIDYRLDAERRVLTLNRLELVLPGLARFELGMILDGVTPAWLADPDAAMDQVSLRTATFAYDDASLLGLLIPKLAAGDGKTGDAYVAGWLVPIGLVAKGQDARFIAVLDAVASFATDYARPKGPLRVTVSPARNLSAKDWDLVSSPEAAIDLLGLAVSYVGTRSGAAEAALATVGAAAATTPAAATHTIDCTPGHRLFVLSDGGWWAATVRDSARSSERCIVRFEGVDEDEDVVVDRGSTMAWSIDGPGEAATRCRKGDRVWIKSDGGWYPASVRRTPRSGTRCTVRLEDDDAAKDETVELRRLRVVRR